MNKIKVVISGIFYPLAMLSYFVRAFERRDDIELTTVGPFTNDWIPWGNGMHLPMKYVKAPTISLPSQMVGQVFGSSLIEHQLGFEPDLWLQIDAGFHFSNRPKAKVVAHIQTDPHVLKNQYQAARSYSDIKFCMQNSYIYPGEYYLPYAFDPTVHYPMDSEKEYDGILIGLQYEQRTQLVNELRRRGYNIHYSIGLVYDEFRMEYNKSRIALNWSSLDDLNARTFEAMGMRLPLLTNRVSDLSTFFIDGEDYLGFNDLDEAVSQFQRLVKDIDLMKYIADNAHRKVIAHHTWDRRVQTILNVCNLHRTV